MESVLTAILNVYRGFHDTHPKGDIYLKHCGSRTHVSLSIGCGQRSLTFIREFMRLIETHASPSAVFQRTSAISCTNLAGTAGFKPATLCLTGRCYCQLSYVPIILVGAEGFEPPIILAPKASGLTRLAYTPKIKKPQGFSP